jgi:alpha-amylase/alpha-mannosidase (GH57 family)
MTAPLLLWHLTPDAPRAPRRVSAGETVSIHLGTWPMAPGQTVWLTLERAAAHGGPERIQARWVRNDGENSYWVASLGPFAEGDEVRYTPQAGDGRQEVAGTTSQFRVGPKIYLSLLWHHHQPIYRLPASPGSSGSNGGERYTTPWVRLHALRDYHSMAALIAEQPDLHATINFTPSLLAQLDGYVRRGATDRALELTLRDAEALSPLDRQDVLATFFDADWHHQVFPHARYRELFEMRASGLHFSSQDVRDLQMWFNLAWFGSEFRTGEVQVASGEVCSVRRFVQQGCGFSIRDIWAMLDEQNRILRAIVPFHARLQERGQLEVSTSPQCHPILPLLIDTDEASVDRPGATLPARFAWPEDAEAHVKSALHAYRGWFGRDPRGMWPAEGAVSQRCIPLFAGAGLAWLATDRGVLARSGRWGYEAHRADVLCQARRAATGDARLAMFFRDTELSDGIGFRYAGYSDPERAAADFVEQVRSRFIARFEGDDDRILTVILDGENAWGSYPDDGRPFLRALYRQLAQLHSELRTVTFAEWLEGNPTRGVRPHPVDGLEPVSELFTGSWIDEAGSTPGVDLGTWIGEPEENRAWELLGDARRWLAERGATAENAPEAFAALYAAEGSDWFWWYGTDQESASDESFDQLFRGHLQSVYRALGAEPPAILDVPLVSPAALWTFVKPIRNLPSGARLAIRTQCPGILRCRWDDGPSWEQPVNPVGGVMAGVSYHQVIVGPFPPGARRLRFEFQCRHAGCPGHGPCCALGWHTVELEG